MNPRKEPKEPTEPKDARLASADDSVEQASIQLSKQVAALRKKKGWTLEQLSAACGVSRSMLSQIERNHVNPTLVVALRIAQAFGISVSDLLDIPNVSPAIDVIRAEDRSYHFRKHGECSIRTLSPLRLEKDVEFYELILRPGGALKSAAHFAGTRELLTVHQGTVRVTSGQEQSELETGGSAHYGADLPHAIENTGTGDVIAFLVVIYRQN